MRRKRESLMGAAGNGKCLKNRYLEEEQFRWQSPFPQVAGYTSSMATRRVVVTDRDGGSPASRSFPRLCWTMRSSSVLRRLPMIRRAILRGQVLLAPDDSRLPV